jgi:hypothetical protein
MDSAEANAATDEHSLFMAAEARIDTALAQLILTTKGVTDATTGQNLAIAEVREARIAIGQLRERLGL